MSIEVLRAYCDDGLTEVGWHVGWDVNFANADFNKDIYMIAKKDGVTCAFVIFNEIRPGILDTHIASNGTMSARENKLFAESVLSNLHQFTDAKEMIGFIESNNKPARAFAYRLGFEAKESIADYTLYRGRLW